MTDLREAVWKYDVPIDLDAADGVSIAMPSESRVIHVGVQTPRAVTFWAQVNPDSPMVTHRFKIVGTGHREVDPTDRYHGTVQINGFVWHLYSVTA